MNLLRGWREPRKYDGPDATLERFLELWGILKYVVLLAIIIVAGKGGGYILCTSHNIQADTPLENLDALLSAYNEYGRYPLSG